MPEGINRMENDATVKSATQRGWSDYHSGLPSEANPWQETSQFLALAWDNGWDYGFSGTAVCAWADYFQKVHGRAPSAAEANAFYPCGLQDITFLLREGCGSWAYQHDRQIALIEWISYQPTAVTVGDISLAFCLPPYDVVSIVQGPLLKLSDLDRPMIEQIVNVELGPDVEEYFESDGFS
jgi:hypothetical protein